MSSLFNLHERLVRPSEVGVTDVTEAVRRRQILEAAEQLLRHYGPSKTTIADIAREAKVGVGSVYLVFPSKEAIIEELSNRRHRNVLDAMRAATSCCHSFAERVRAMVYARVAAYLGLCDEGAHARDLVHCVSPAVKTAQARFRADELKFVADLLREATHAGEFDVPDPDATAQAILRAYSTFAPPFLFAYPRADVETALDAMHDLVLFGLLRRKGEPQARVSPAARAAGRRTLLHPPKVPSTSPRKSKQTSGRR
jgi:AcrR family transcriptional regulator